MLEDAGCRLQVVANGEEAVQAALGQRFDLIFMDCHMPVCDGFSATRRIRASGGPCAAVPVIALTADVLPQTRQLCREVGMNDYLAKPFLRATLTELLTRWLSAARRGTEVMVLESPGGPESSLGRSTGAFDPKPLARIGALKMAREKRLVPRAVEIYLTEAKTLLQRIEAASTAQDHQALREAAHRLKSSSAHVGAMKVSMLAHELEQLAITGAAAQRLRGPRQALAVAHASSLADLEPYLQDPSE
jgi:CheY-like chemotaxis protein